MLSPLRHLNAEEGLSPLERELLTQLYSADERERVNAAIKLSSYSDTKEVVEALINAAASDPDQMVARVSLRSLGHMGAEDALELILEKAAEAPLPVMMEAMSAARNFSDQKVLEMLLEKASDPNSLIRQRAIGYLWDRDDDRIKLLLLKKLEDPAEGVRLASLKAIDQREQTGASEVLEVALGSDRSPAVREEAARALEKYTNRAKALKSALNDSDLIVRMTAARSLAGQGSSSGLKTAIQEVKSSDARVRVLAVEIIGLVGSVSNRVFLEEASRDYDRRVQRAAEAALKEMEKRIKIKEKSK